MAAGGTRSMYSLLGQAAGELPEEEGEVGMTLENTVILSIQPTREHLLFPEI